jgi:hypothetical protein
MGLSQETRNAIIGSFTSVRGAHEVIHALEVSQGGVADASFSIGTEDGSSGIVVSIQLLDEEGDAIAEACAVLVLVLADAAGAAFNTADYTIAAGTDGDLVEVLADKVLLGISETDGDLDVSLTISGAGTCYLAVVLPGGKLAVSTVITHAA